MFHTFIIFFFEYLPFIKSVPWTLAEFRPNRIVQSPREHFNVMSATQRVVRSCEDDDYSNSTNKYGLLKTDRVSCLTCCK